MRKLRFLWLFISILLLENSVYGCGTIFFQHGVNRLYARIQAKRIARSLLTLQLAQVDYGPLHERSIEEAIHFQRLYFELLQHFYLIGPERRLIDETLAIIEWNHPTLTSEEAADYLEAYEGPWVGAPRITDYLSADDDPSPEVEQTVCLFADVLRRRDRLEAMRSRGAPPSRRLERHRQILERQRIH